MLGEVSSLLRLYLKSGVDIGQHKPEDIPWFFQELRRYYQVDSGIIAGAANGTYFYLGLNTSSAYYDQLLAGWMSLKCLPNGHFISINRKDRSMRISRYERLQSPFPIDTRFWPSFPTGGRDFISTNKEVEVPKNLFLRIVARKLVIDIAEESLQSLGPDPKKFSWSDLIPAATNVRIFLNLPHFQPALPRTLLWEIEEPELDFRAQILYFHSDIPQEGIASQLWLRDTVSDMIGPYCQVQQMIPVGHTTTANPLVAFRFTKLLNHLNQLWILPADAICHYIETLSGQALKGLSEDIPQISFAPPRGWWDRSTSILLHPDGAPKDWEIYLRDGMGRFSRLIELSWGLEDVQFVFSYQNELGSTKKFMVTPEFLVYRGEDGLLYRRGFHIGVSIPSDNGKSSAPIHLLPHIIQIILKHGRS